MSASTWQRQRVLGRWRGCSGALLLVSSRRIQSYRELLYSHHDTHTREKESVSMCQTVCARVETQRVRTLSYGSFSCES